MFPSTNRFLFIGRISVCARVCWSGASADVCCKSLYTSHAIINSQYLLFDLLNYGVHTHEHVALVIARTEWMIERRLHSTCSLLHKHIYKRRRC